MTRLRVPYPRQGPLYISSHTCVWPSSSPREFKTNKRMPITTQTSPELSDGRKHGRDDDNPAKYYQRFPTSQPAQVEESHSCHAIEVPPAKRARIEASTSNQRTQACPLSPTLTFHMEVDEIPDLSSISLASPDSMTGLAEIPQSVRDGEDIEYIKCQLSCMRADLYEIIVTLAEIRALLARCVSESRGQYTSQ
ncbi:uncharacterized protein B0H18DRAFT_963430 [Fomitopsis serialis]|uniref:uncharacterized protein n=1 Tax=Fomitopsis serialis TaxID=139415 RepID=UPI0020076B60|nr:uncharacterized protein B0H18DRAFT_963430 [Neoantrodia serialis]KAH9910388.1 hypothetical protein B0H18DRAFT_963430 [Neoantrodia serialis]